MPAGAARKAKATELLRGVGEYCANCIKRRYKKGCIPIRAALRAMWLL
jgi:hypothetical protein